VRVLWEGNGEIEDDQGLNPRKAGNSKGLDPLPLFFISFFCFILFLLVSFRILAHPTGDRIGEDGGGSVGIG
jgi:hypothetical protein